MILEAEGVTMSLAFVLYKLLFHKTIDIKFIVTGLWNPEFIVVDICSYEQQLLNAQLQLCPVFLAIKYVTQT